MCLCWAPGSDPTERAPGASSHQRSGPPTPPPPFFFQAQTTPRRVVGQGSSLKQSLIKTTDGADPMEAFRD